MKTRMMARPIAQYLAEFGASPLADVLGDASPVTIPCPPDEPVTEDLMLSLQRARDEGMSEGYAAARDEYEAQLQRVRLSFEARLTAEREVWTRQESEKLSEDIKAIFAEIESNIAGCVERVLKPFVIECLRRQMIDLLAEAVGVLLSGGESPLIEIRGPEDLLAMLREKLAILSGTINYSPDDSVDVRIVAGQTLIESRIGAWAERIKSMPE